MSEGQMMELVIVRVGEISFGTENILFREPMEVVFLSRLNFMKFVLRRVRRQSEKKFVISLPTYYC